MMLLGCYMEAVMPKTFGNSRHMCFCLRCTAKKPRFKTDTSFPEQEKVDYAFETKFLKRENFEPAETEYYS